MQNTNFLQVKMFLTFPHLKEVFLWGSQLIGSGDDESFLSDVIEPGTVGLWTQRVLELWVNSL